MAGLEYRNRSISQLVSELNSLGEAKVVLEPVRLLAVHQFDLEYIKRFKNSHGEQFFTMQNNDKKYFYNEIVQQITSGNLRLQLDLLEKGFNVSLMLGMPREQAKLSQLLGELVKIVGPAVYSTVQFGENQISDTVGQSKLNERELDKLTFYRVKEENALVFMDKVLRRQGKEITLLKIRRLNGNQIRNNQLTLIVLPEIYFSSKLKTNEYLSIVKSQLTQIFNYIKLNPAKKYQHFSKLLTKRLPITNAIASLVLEESLCMAVNWVNEGDAAQLAERLSFYEKVRGLSAFLKVAESASPTVAALPSSYVQSNIGAKKQASNPFKAVKTDRTPISHLLSADNELQYCRSFQRKTHRHSLNDQNQGDQLFSYKENNYQGPSEFNLNSHNPSPVTHHRSEKIKNQPIGDRRLQQNEPKKLDSLRQSQEIAILKANHAVEISQYHQTIQQLNKKLLALTHENQVEQLYTIHERELMLLQLKIKELRNDIDCLTAGADEKTYKAMVRKLNEEIKRLELKNAEQKVSNAKVATLEKQLQEMKKKYEESENIRKKLAYQLDYLTKRLKICDAEIEQLNQKGAILNEVRPKEATIPSNVKLSVKEAQSLREVQILIDNLKQGSDQAGKYLLRKVTNVLQDLGGCRNLILDCNDFLMQLEQHLEQKLGSKQPQIVLDCNKFIRNFLMDNLNIF